ncbi:uncharacterized protein LOC123550883 [Mercenaria mercenaria]|uniref:uncharacterized protein LOC123550883 n=1 Tax=Mercenaria mercenaria TaxID=6596 RepID=UPI00234E6D58|nr:uncharacterized protein LOC123550883 [Mercenaria mercenaria]
MANSKYFSDRRENRMNPIDYEDDFGIDVDIEVEFVGRESDLHVLQNAWKNHKIFGIFGLRSVGKSRLVKEFWSRKKTEGFELIHIDMKLISDISSLYANICAALRIEPEIQATDPDRWIHHICEALKTTNGKYFIFFFDNTEDCQEFKGVNTRDSFLSLCTSLVRLCKNVKVFITSTTRVQLAQLKRVYCSHELLPLSQTESRQLLKYVTQGIELGEYEDSIVNLSEGMPLLILMIGSELTDDGGLITPKDMVEFLLTCRLKALSREFYSVEDRVADIYKKFIDRLDAVYKRRLTVLEYIPGSFNAEQAKELLDSKSVATVKDQTLIPIRRRHVLNYDPKTRRFSIQGIIRECVKTYYTIKNIPEIRARYCRIFSAVMQNISVRLGTVEYTQALAAFAVEQPNLQKLLTEVNYTRQDTYQFFIEMATNCTDLIERYMAGDGEDFYQGCLRAADMYGQERDKATVNLAVGSMYTNTKGYLSRGADNYESALRVLENHGRSLQLATVYQRLGWNMLQQARNLDANRYFQKSLAISLVSGEEFKLVSLQSMSSMGLSLSQLGKFDDSERYHFACLKQRLKALGENHPNVGVCYNNIGVMYEQKGDADNAFKYYKKGLEVKVKSKAPIMSVVFSLSNVANMSSSMGNYREAHRLIDDALKRLSEEKIPPRESLACTYETKGKIYLREEKFIEAEEMLQKAVDIREEIAENMLYLESLVHLADANRRSGNFERSISIAKQGLKLKTKATASMPQNTFVAECLVCIADVYDRTNNIERHRETLEKIESELLRLEQVYLCQCNEKGYEKIRTQLKDVKDKLDNAPN